MKNIELSELKLRLSALTVFRELQKDKVIRALNAYLNIPDNAEVTEKLLLYCEFVSALYEANGGDITGYVDELCANSENVYVKEIGCKKIPPDSVTECIKNELETFDMIARLTPEMLMQNHAYTHFVPKFTAYQTNIAEKYLHRTQNIEKYGYGKYAKNSMFYISESGEIVPVEHPDPIDFDSLVEYRLEREKVLENTEALLNGRPAANILLTGDAGTGKSSTVKAVCNRFYSEGLRLIEIRQTQLTVIPRILNELSTNPLKFILFIDDLSFLKDDENFNVFKAVLEGSVSTKSENVVIYATSNRRHIIKETFSDREGDEIHKNDTVQELISLSARFGMHITFSKPNRETYLKIAKALAKKNELDISDTELELLAERFALEKGGRSPRYARQLIDELVSKRK